MPGLILLLLALGALFLWFGRRQAGRLGLPAGRVVAIDTSGFTRPERPLYDRDLDLLGRPDYLVETPNGPVPVEVKAGSAPSAPYESHVLQLAAYCRLAEVSRGKRPAHGILKYGDRTFAVDYTLGLRNAPPIAPTPPHSAAGAAGIVRSATSASPERAATTRSAIIPVMPPQPSPRRIAIGTHPRLPEADALGEEIAAHLRTLGLTASCASLYDTDLRRAVQARSFELFIALGGDGTMLRAGHLCGPSGVPILGVNLGRFGFLTEVSREGWMSALERVLAGGYWLERRMMLRAEHLRAGQPHGGGGGLKEC